MVRTTLIAGLRGTQKEEWRNGGEGVGREGFREWKRLGARPSGIILAPPVRTTLPNNLSRGSRRCYKSHSTVTILVRSGRYNVAGQCLLFRPQCRISRHIRQTSHGGLLIQLLVLDGIGTDWPKLLSWWTCERQLRWNVSGGTYLLIPLCNMRSYQVCKCQNVALCGTPDPETTIGGVDIFFTRGKYSISCVSHDCHWD